MHRDAIIPTASNVDSVHVPALRVLVVATFTSEETGEFLAPVSTKAVAVKAENNEQSVAKTVRPVRRGRA